MAASAILEFGARDDHGRGPVHAAQWLLAGHNVFKTDFGPGPIDGIYGKGTEAAAHRAKETIGYPTKGIDGRFGPELRKLLLGETKLPAGYARRMRDRAHKAATYVYPALLHVPLIGYPGQGTHSWSAPPNNWQSDNAWDFAFPHGTSLIATADGKIGAKIGPISSDPNSRFGGLRCYLECDNGNQFYYAHLSSILVRPGDRMKQGDRIGLSGSASGVNHLHMGVLRWQEYRPIAEGR